MNSRRDAPRRLRVLLFSERLRPPFDEGIKNHVAHLLVELGRRCDMLALTTFGEDIAELGVRNVRSNSLQISPWLFRAIASFAPDLIVYVPTACATPFSFWRSRVLALYGRATVAMVALQQRRYGAPAANAMRLLRPHHVLVQSRDTGATLQGLGCRTSCLRPAVDLEVFHPPEAREKAALRARYGLAEGRYVVLHVGHINRGRNVQALARVQALEDVDAVLVGSTSTLQDEALRRELEQAGVHVIREYLPDIASIYRMADCYLFPVGAGYNAIDVPLSVLEAMATGLPVVTTRFGGLETWFDASAGFHYTSDEAGMIAAIRACRALDDAGTRETIAAFDWASATEQLLADTAQLIRSSAFSQAKE